MGLSGVVSAHECYTVRELRRRCSLGNYSWRQFRREVPIVKIGRKHFVLGRSFLAWIEQHEATREEGVKA